MAVGILRLHQRDARARWNATEWHPISNKLTPRNNAVAQVLHQLGVAPDVRLLSPRWQVDGPTTPVIHRADP
jgi:hypothetical protein